MATTGDAHEVSTPRPGSREVRRPAWFAYLLALICLATPLQALADVPGLTLSWSAPVGCPAAAEVEQDIARLVGEQATHKSLDAHVEVELVSGRFQALVTIDGGATGTRQLHGVSCAAIARATAVVIALAIEPKPPPTTAPIAKAQPFRPRSRPEAQKRLVPFVRAFVSAPFGSLPKPTPELGGGMGLQYERFETEVTLAYASPSELRVGSSLAGARVARARLTGVGCFAAIATSATGFDVCPGAEVERYAAEALGVSNPGSASTWLFSPALTLKSRTRLSSRLALVLSVTSVVRPYHPQFAITNVGVVYAIPVVGGALTGGLQFAF